MRQNSILAVVSVAAIGTVSCTNVEGTEKAAPISDVNATAYEWGACPPVFPAGCEIAVLHGNPAEANADVLLRVPGDYEIPAHSHTSAERMVLLSGNLQVQYQRQDSYRLNQGEYAYGPAALPHKAKCISAEPCMLFIAFEAPVDAMAYEGSLE